MRFMSFDISGLRIVVSRNPLGLSRADTNAHLQSRGAVAQERIDALTDFVLTTAAEAAKPKPTTKVAAARKGLLPVVTDIEWNSLRSKSDLMTLLSRKRSGTSGSPAAAASAAPTQPTSAPATPAAKRKPTVKFAPIDSPYTTCL
jgi:hypothetical protein